MLIQNAWFIFQNGQLILSNDNTILLDSPLLAILKIHFVHEHFIGVYNGISCYSAELGTDIMLAPELQQQPLRKAFTLLGEPWLNALARAASILNWERTHQFCGQCGHQTLLSPSQINERYCPSCHLVFYPRISPSVIVLISRGDEILMARSPHFTPGAYGLIAGFVEAGERLEDTIHREIKEEVNITVKNIRYIGSQSWPFPDSLMIGFMAEYAEGELIIDHKEIEEANWYHYTALPGRPSVSISIANKLIELFIAERGGKTT